MTGPTGAPPAENIATLASSGGGQRLLPGPTTLAGAQLAAAALQRVDVDPQTRTRLLAALGDLLPGRPLAPGAAAGDRSLPAGTLAGLIPSAAIVAAGFDPATVTITDGPPTALWRSGAQQLLLRVGKVHADLSDGLIEIVVPVFCDQTGDVEISVAFVTGSPDRPAGGIATTEDHPRGPAVVVENWAEPLIAYAWHTLVIATSAFSSAAGSDVAGHDLVTAALAISADGVTVTPMGQHTFLANAVAR